MFFWEFPKNIQDSYFKRKPSNACLYFIKEQLWMSVSDEATLQKVFGGSKPSLKLNLKTKWHHSCSCCNDSWSCEQLKKRVTDKYFLKKLHLEPLSPSVTGNVCYHYKTWVTGVFMVYMFDRNSAGKTSQIEWLFESNLRSSGYFKCSAVLWLLLDPSCNGNLLTKVGWVLQAQIYPDGQNGAFAKNGSCIQNLDTTLTTGRKCSCLIKN